MLKCNTFLSKFKGLMFKRNIKEGILLCNCNSIHTFFMLDSIDVVMVDKANKVIYLYEELKPWRVILPKKKVINTYELPKGSIKKYNIKLNQKLED
jgi:hypothetical protein